MLSLNRYREQERNFCNTPHTNVIKRNLKDMQLIITVGMFTFSMQYTRCIYIVNLVNCAKYVNVTLALFTFRMLERFELSTKHLTKSLPFTDFKENMGGNQGCLLLIL